MKTVTGTVEKEETVGKPELHVKWTMSDGTVVTTSQRTEQYNAMLDAKRKGHEVEVAYNENSKPVANDVISVKYVGGGRVARSPKD